MTGLVSRRKMLALCGTMVGLSGCSGGINDPAPPPTTTGVPTTIHESTATPTPTQTPTPNPSLLRTAIIDTENIDEGFEVPALKQIVIGQDIAIIYEAEVPFQDGSYEAVVTVGLSELDGPFNSEDFFRHRGSADGERARIVGHARYPTEHLVPGELLVDVSVAQEMPGPWDGEDFIIEVVRPTEEGSSEN